MGPKLLAKDALSMYSIATRRAGSDFGPEGSQEEKALAMSDFCRSAQEGSTTGARFGTGLFPNGRLHESSRHKCPIGETCLPAQIPIEANELVSIFLTRSA